MGYNAIGNYQFTRIEGEPLVIARQGSLLSRPGVDGVGAVRTGRRGQPFTLRTAVDQPSLWAASQTFAEYQQLKWGDPVEIVIDSVDYLQFGARYLVMEVQPLRKIPTFGAVGVLWYSFAGVGGAYLEAEWQLCPIAAT